MWGGGRPDDNRHPSKPGQKCQVSSARSAPPGAPLPAGQLRPDPPPDLRQHGSGCPPAPTTRPRLQGKDPRAAACPPTHLRAPMFLFFLVRRRLELELRRPHHPRPHSCPAHSPPEMLPPGLFFPLLLSPQYGVTSACARCSSARRESGSRERARSVSKAGARSVDDNKFVAQGRSLSRLSRQPSVCPSYCLRTVRALRKLSTWGARFCSAPSPRRA